MNDIEDTYDRDEHFESLGVPDYHFVGFELYCSDVDGCGPEAATTDTYSAFEDAYMGEFEDEVAWAADYLDATGQLEEIPERLRYYFDYEAFARDCSYDGTSFVKDCHGSTHVFNS